MKFASVCIHTDNAPRLAEFYEKVLQEKPEVDGTHYGFSKIAVYDDGNVTMSEHKNMSIMLSTEDLQVEYNRLLKEFPDLVVTSPPQRRPWGAFSFWFLDLDGNTVSVFEYKED
ncbi:MAG: hypothetical protein VB118_12215 [Oscillospiraceae bacterium]|nr:hypothetical protein [Oscillospiraceae bacterium]